MNKANVAARLKEIKGDKEAKDEAAVLNDWLKLNDEEADLKKRLKDAEAALDAKAYAKYPKLTEAEIKTLVVDDKWLAALDAAIHGEMDRISQAAHPAREGTGRTLRNPAAADGQPRGRAGGEGEPPPGKDGVLMEVKPGYKQTEVGVIPEDWDVTTIGAHLCRFQKRQDAERREDRRGQSQTLSSAIEQCHRRFESIWPMASVHVKTDSRDLKRCRLRQGRPAR